MSTIDVTNNETVMEHFWLTKIIIWFISHHQSGKVKRRSVLELF